MAAVHVKNGFKFYGDKSTKHIVLNNLNMNVQPGSIYGLLGASGCGKTTLLSCIVGLKRLNGGEVRVLGENPEDMHIGNRIGYMPQEIALVAQMSVKESILYFGRIYGMSLIKIEEKFHELNKLLELPSSTQLIQNCSGGQQRRVSFACALIHDPELLILDEPTVGLDPMLRERIWHFLVANSRRSNTAVIITTHYIEEARQARYVGLMREGILLVEDTPNNILMRFQVESLEEAFLMLSQKQKDSDTNSKTQLTDLGNEEVEELPQTIAMENLKNKMLQTPTNEQTVNRLKHTKSNFAIFKALLLKNFTLMVRHPGIIFFLLISPLISLGAFYTSVGTTLKGQRLGVVNMESSCDDLNMTSVINLEETCHLQNISCQFIKELGSTDFIKPIYYSNLAEAHRDAKDTSIIGYIHIPYNFSLAMQMRLEDGRFADNEALDQTIMDTHLDMGAGQSVFNTELKILDHFKSFIRQIFRDCNLSEKLSVTPVVFNEPIYGSDNNDYQKFMTPGLVLTIVFFLNTLVTSNIFIDERSAGVWDRTLIAGASANQLMWSNFLTQLSLTTIQNLEAAFYAWLVFREDFLGSKIAFISLVFLVSICGMFYGLLLSIYCKTHANSTYMCSGSFYILILTSGLLWPLEGMPKILQTLFMCSPFTLPGVSARNIVQKGWELTHSGVYMGYLIIMAWIFILYAVCIIGIRRKM